MANKEKKDGTKGISVKKTIKGRRFGNQFCETYTEKYLDKLGDALLDWFEQKGNVWLKDFFIEQRIPYSKIIEFKTKSEYFAYVYNVCKDLQESKLVKMGFNPKVKPTMPIFALKNVHGWKDSSTGINIEKVEGVVFFNGEEKDEK